MIHMSETEVHLKGDWTLTEVARNIDSLTRSLQQVDRGNMSTLHVDCGQMEKADMSGLQLLNVWMQCLRFRGIEPTLVNVPDKVRSVLPFFIEDVL